MSPRPRHTPTSRRQFIAQLGALTAGLHCARAATEDPSPLAASFDPVMESFMSDRGFPGGSLAVIRDGRMVFAKGYGWADVDAGEKAGPDSLFRLASLSKPITAMAVMTLVESGGLDLDDPFAELLRPNKLFPAADQWPEGWDRVTIRHLLEHVGGWDREVSFDPMFRTRAIQEALHLAGVPDTWDVIRYMSGHPLDQAPGARYAYSNFGYCILGRVIEQVTGMGYEAYVKKQLLVPLGIRTMRLGATRAGERARGEVRYYMPDGRKARSVFPDVEARVPWPYGGFLLEIMDAHGGWVASAPDLARLSIALQGQGPTPILKPKSVRRIAEPPEPPASRKDGELEATYYGLGWMIRPLKEEGRYNAWHSGSLPGTSTIWIRRADGIAWAALFNQRSDQDRAKDSEIDFRLNRAINRVKQWPG